MQEFEEHLIPNRIRTIRKKLNLTLDELASKINMSRAYVSKLERSRKAPPISTLFKIAKSLNVDLNYLITGISGQYNNQKVSLVAEDEQLGVIHQRSSYGYIYKALAYKKNNKLMEAFKIIVPSKEEQEPFIHDGEEFNYLLKGKARVFVDGEWYLMNEGDSIYYDSALPHYAVSIGGKEAIFLQVNTQPKNK
ncbi:MAG: helix-turn-helix transcriptional regulator [Actinobacteria bacterium]|nr:helix-turn-helix transcriptional regulator [Actinomycetota bacterium]